MAGTFEIYRDKAGAFRFRLKAGNGETVLSSEGYSAKASAKNGIASVQKNCKTKSRFAKSETRAGKFRFNLKARNHQVIGTSQGYDSASSRDKGIEAVGRAAKGAKIKDISIKA
ncbi:MAG: YegP family protein [Gemmatimonadota bacterium]